MGAASTRPCPAARSLCNATLCACLALCSRAPGRRLTLLHPPRSAAAQPRRTLSAPPPPPLQRPRRVRAAGCLGAPAPAVLPELRGPGLRLCISAGARRRARGQAPAHLRPRCARLQLAHCPLRAAAGTPRWPLGLLRWAQPAGVHRGDLPPAQLQPAQERTCRPCPPRTASPPATVSAAITARPGPAPWPRPCRRRATGARQGGAQCAHQRPADGPVRRPRPALAQPGNKPRGRCACAAGNGCRVTNSTEPAVSCASSLGPAVQPRLDGAAPSAAFEQAAAAASCSRSAPAVSPVAARPASSKLRQVRSKQIAQAAKVGSILLCS